MGFEIMGNVPDTLDKIMVMIYIEEEKDAMSSKKMMLKKLKMLKKLFSMIMDNVSKKEALLMDQWIQFMKRIKEKVAEGNVDKDMAKLLAYMWQMTVGNDMGDLWGNKEEFMYESDKNGTDHINGMISTLMDPEKDKEVFGGKNETVDSQFESGKNASMVRLGMLLKKMTAMFEKMVMKLTGKYDISNMKANVPDLLDKMIYKLEKEGKPEKDSIKVMMMQKTIKMINALFALVMDDEPNPDGNIMDQWTEFMRKTKEIIQSGEIDDEMS